MAIISIQRDQNNTISIVRMQVSDPLATVSMTDYILDNQEAINALNGGTWQWFITDMILVAAEDGNAFYEFVDTSFDTIVIFGQKGTGTVNPGLTNNIPYYAANGNTLSPLSNLANAILATNGSEVPGLTQTLPTAVQANISTVGTIGTGIWEGSNIGVPFGGTGVSSFTAYSVICAGTTSTGNLQAVSGVGTTGQVLTSNGVAALPTWQASPGSGTVNSGLQNQLAFYATNGTAVSGLTSIASGVLITSGLGVPSISQTLPSAVQSNITALGTIATGLWEGTPIGAQYGGTGLSAITANNLIIGNGTSAATLLAPSATSGVPLISQGASSNPAYGTAVVAGGGTGLTTLTAYAVLCGGTTATGNLQQVSGLGSSGQVLTSNGTGALPTWQSVSGSGTVDSGLINQLAWYAASGTAVSGLTTLASGVLVTSAGSVPSISTTLPNGLAMGTPASITLTNATGLPIGGITGLGTGVATALAANVNGSGAISLTTSPTFVTPTLGAATATSLAFSPTTGGIIGTTTNDNAGTGKVGEYIFSQILQANQFSISTGVTTNVTSITLTAGDWDVSGNIFFGASGGTGIFGAGYASISLTSNTLADQSLNSAIFLFPTSVGLANYGAPVTPQRFSLSTTTTIYLVANAQEYGSGVSVLVCGFIGARRAR